MTHGSTSALPTCPDCGGILEPSRPSWAVTIEVVALRPDLAPGDAGAWRCPLCGYSQLHQPARSTDRSSHE